ncbi:Protein of unknown function (DUF3592) [Parelusimicrobium proximum]|uniref:DUF3592 domain-containing protein n=1 Tax=Parelusimicrobium proximum TaxID=3228953 RepID=UPI003D17E1FE
MENYTLGKYVALAGLVIAGVSLIWSHFKELRKLVYVQKNWRAAFGTLTNVQTNHKDEVVSAEIKYLDSEETEHQVRSEYLGDMMRNGDSVPIYYDPANPDKATIHSVPRFLKAGGYILAGIGLIIAAALYGLGVFSF